MFRSKEKDILFVLLLELAELMKNGSEEFTRIKTDGEGCFEQVCSNMEKNKEASKVIINRILIALDKTLITPIEREDILHLAERMVSAINAHEACAARFAMYAVEKQTDEISVYVDLIEKTSKRIYECVSKLVEKRFSEMNEHILKIYGKVEDFHQFERKTIKRLFTDYKEDPVLLIQYKDLYDFLSRIIMKQEKVAQVLGTIIMKNA